MKAVVIKSSQLGTQCWLAKRFTGSCDTCEKCRPEKGHRRCELPEAKLGRAKQRKQRKAYLKQQIAEMQKELDGIKTGD